METASNILSRNLSAQYSQLPRQGKLNRVASHYGCGFVTAARLVDHADFETIVQDVERTRVYYSLPQNCASIRKVLVAEL